MYHRLRNLREDRDLTQAAVAAVLHVSQTTYSRYESGTLDIPQRVADRPGPVLRDQCGLPAGADG